MTSWSVVASPCNNVCRIDDASGWCIGCLRTLDEIAAWASIGDDERRAVLAELPARREQWQARRRAPSEDRRPG
jgi:uncharacterized protein